MEHLQENKKFTSLKGRTKKSPFHFISLALKLTKMFRNKYEATEFYSTPNGVKVVFLLVSWVSFSHFKLDIFY